MKIAGIVAEYNPFHLGHQYMINTVRESGCTHVVAVISGSFVQRGDAGIMSVSARTKAALTGGADLVLLLPTPYSMATAETFTHSAVSILESTGIIDILAFGCENDDVNLLRSVCDVLEIPEFKEHLKQELDAGVTFAAARAAAAARINPDSAEILRTPNNILAVGYLAALKSLNSRMDVLPVGRTGAAHDELTDTKNGVVSASKIRYNMVNGLDIDGFLPSGTLEIYKRECESGRAPASIYRLERAILSKIRTLSNDDLAGLPDISEGIERRMQSSAGAATSLDELYGSIKTKRYTHARIRRLVLSAFLSLNNSLTAEPPSYIQAVGIGKNGTPLMKAMKSRCGLTVITKPAAGNKLTGHALEVFKAESRASDIWGLCCPEIQSGGADFTQLPVIIS